MLVKPVFSLELSSMASSEIKQIIGELNKESFVDLLTKLIGESKYLQNNPPELIPEEDRVVNHLLEILSPLSTTTGGGPLIINHATYYPKRGNLIVEYPGTQPGKVLSFVGCHMDVVTANPTDWVLFSSLNFCYFFFVKFGTFFFMGFCFCTELGCYLMINCVCLIFLAVIVVDLFVGFTFWVELDGFL